MWQARSRCASTMCSLWYDRKNPDKKTEKKMLFGQSHNLLRKNSAFLFLTFAAALSFIFRDTLSAMVGSWQRDEYSHGYLIPLLSLVLFLNKMEGTKLPPRAAWFGVAFVIAGVAAQFIFLFAGVKGLLPQIYLLSLIGLIGLFWGKDFLRASAGPLALLFFCAPLPQLLYYIFSFDMQMLSSSLGSKILTLLNVPVFQEGNIIDLGGYKLQVIEACSGLRYLFPLLGLSFLLAYIYKTATWKRVLVFVSAVPISIFMNGLRVAIIGITVDQWGTAMAEGVLHEFEGWIVFAGCTALLLLEVVLLQKIGRTGDVRFEELRIPSLRGLPPPALGKMTVVCAIFLTVTVALSVAMPPFLADYLRPVQLQQPMAFFPLQLGQWIGRPQTIPADALQVIGTDEYFIADYVKNGVPPVNLYALYYPQQDSTSNQAAHPPTLCIPGGGWKIIKPTKKDIPRANRPPLSINKMVVTKGIERQLVYYWFIQDGRETTSPITSRLSIIKNALTTGRTNGAMVRFYTPVSEGESAEAAEQRLDGFLNDNLDTLVHYMFGARG